MISCIEFSSKKRSERLSGKALFLAIILAETNKLESLLKAEQKNYVKKLFYENLSNIKSATDKIIEYKSKLKILKALPKLVQELL